MSALPASPTVIPIDSPYNDWQWRVRQVDLGDGKHFAFVAERIGVNGQRGWNYIGEFSTPEQAKAAAEKNRARSVASRERYLEARG